MAEGRQRLQMLESEAADWLAAHPTATVTAALFESFTAIPYLRDLNVHHPGYVAQSEQTLETTFCVGLDGGLPLPLPQSHAQCTCTELGDVSVERIHLSGSSRECSDVRLFPEEASDIDVMLQLGPMHVKEDYESQLGEQKTRENGSNVLPGSMREDSGVGSEAMTDVREENQEICQKSLDHRKEEDGEAISETIVWEGKLELGDPEDPLLADSKEEGNKAGENCKEVGIKTCGASKGYSEAREENKEKDSEAGEGDPNETSSVCSDDVFLSAEGIPEAWFVDGARGDAPPSPPPPDGPRGITVALEPADHLGFFLLRHRRMPGCRHRDRLPLSARRVVLLMDSVRALLTGQTPTVSGPAVSATIKVGFLDPKAIDLVACVRCPRWPCEDFSSRPRPSGQPRDDLVTRLCGTPAFLVPVGFAGSETEELEWRLSFSRQEYIAYRSMTEKQRVRLTTLKHCRAVVGEAAKPLKSYYLKTALLWLVESRAANQWTLETMHDSLLLILRYLDICLRRGYMPCYFWPDVNLLASRSAAERAELTAAVAELSRRLLSTVLALLADWLGQPVPALAQYLLLDGRKLSVDQQWDMIGSHMLCELTGGRWRRPVYALRDLVFNGKLALVASDDTQYNLPLCSALTLGVEAGREFYRRMRREARSGDRGLSMEIRNAIGLAQPIFKLAQHIRGPNQQDDSWMVED